MDLIRPEYNLSSSKKLEWIALIELAGLEERVHKYDGNKSSCYPPSATEKEQFQRLISSVFPDKEKQEAFLNSFKTLIEEVVYDARDYTAGSDPASKITPVESRNAVKSYFYSALRNI